MLEHTALLICDTHRLPPVKSLLPTAFSQTKPKLLCRHLHKYNRVLHYECSRRNQIHCFWLRSGAFASARTCPFVINTKTLWFLRILEQCEGTRRCRSQNYKGVRIFRHCHSKRRYGRRGCQLSSAAQCPGLVNLLRGGSASASRQQRLSCSQSNHLELGFLNRYKVSHPKEAILIIISR